MRKVFVLRYKGPDIVEAFESCDDAMGVGVEFITEMGKAKGLSEMEINEEVYEFVRFKDVEAVEFYCCKVKEARQ